MRKLHRLMRRTSFTPTCWLWLGYTTPFGHGQIKSDGQAREVHRYAWQIIFQEILTSEEIIRHRCDTPNCWRPSHLLKGTHTDNVSDRVARNRSAHGSGHGRSKLTERDVIEIKERLNKNESDRSISKDFNVDPRAIGKIRLLENWRHIEIS